jgi:hypothetical protein
LLAFEIDRARNRCNFQLRLTATDEALGFALAASGLAFSRTGLHSIIMGSRFLQLNTTDTGHPTNQGSLDDRLSASNPTDVMVHQDSSFRLWPTNRGLAGNTWQSRRKK